MVRIPVRFPLLFSNVIFNFVYDYYMQYCQASMPLWLCSQQSGHLTLAKLPELLNCAHFGTQQNLYVENIYSNCIISITFERFRGKMEKSILYRNWYNFTSAYTSRIHSLNWEKLLKLSKTSLKRYSIRCVHYIYPTYYR